jgi:hypothetical protein
MEQPSFKDLQVGFTLALKRKVRAGSDGQLRPTAHSHSSFSSHQAQTRQREGRRGLGENTKVLLGII